MRLLVDGDACPVKELLWRAAHRHALPLILVVNKPQRFGQEAGVTQVVVPAGPDEADRWIADALTSVDLVVTADIPLAAAVVERGARALGHRGELFDASTIGEHVSRWSLMKSLRDSGLETGGPRPFGPADRQSFANALDRLLSARSR